MHSGMDGTGTRRRPAPEVAAYRKGIPVRHLVAALLLFAWALPGPTSLRAAPSLAALNIRTGDVPPGLLLYASRVLTPARWDATQHDAAGTAAVSGMVGISFEIFYVGSVARHALVGLVARYASAAAARLAYGRIVAPIAKAHAAGGRPLAAAGLGEERYGFIDPASSAGAAIYFRRGGYVASVGVQGYTTPLSPALVVRLAGIVDGRIRRAR